MARRLHLRRHKSASVDLFDNRAKLYSLAAAAASVSVLALTPPAEGSVVITNTNIPITSKGISIDLNKDGITDVHFKYLSNLGASNANWYFSVKGVVGNAIEASHQGEDALALARSAKIGPSAHFGNASANPLLMVDRYCSASGCKLYGYWGGNKPNRFVGVKFNIKGAVHYGWIRVTITTNTISGKPMKGTVTEYGYETIANKVVKAGLASTNVASTEAGKRDGRIGPSLGAMALGADGLVLWRRDKDSVAG